MIMENTTAVPTAETDNPVKMILLSREELNDIYKEAATIGARTALESFEKEKKKQHKQASDKRFRNTKLLLRNYRMLKTNIDHSVYREIQIDESATDILNSMINMYNNDEVIVESIKQSMKRTAIMVSHIDTMLDLYKAYCEKAVNDIEQRRYEVVYDMYITENPLNAVAVAEKQGMSKENVYQDIKAAVEKISALIFGVDGLK